MKYDRIGFGSFFSFFFLFPIFWDLLNLSHRFHLIAAVFCVWNEEFSWFLPKLMVATVMHLK
ncbi:unnamed protein product [Coffea canephora]|uniref:Uncharacterized protein n=1 Tax=Coffea canephora TaxID=49390 RepID=A0A068VF07_COFCA|nr:unnamed protein product [Coffea canephora]